MSPPKRWRKWGWITLIGGMTFPLFFSQLLPAPPPFLLLQISAPPPSGSQSSEEEIPAHGKGQQLLGQAIVQLESLDSISGKFYYYFELFSDQPLSGTATYSAQLTQAGQLFRWELHPPFPIQWGQIFDGQNLWTYQADPTKKNPQVTRVDVLEVAQYLKEKGNLPKIGEIGNWPGLGGLSRLLRCLYRHFHFQLAEKTTLRVTDGQSTCLLPVWKLQGEWNPQSLAELLPKQADQIPPPPHLPQRVTVLLGQEDLFPYQIQFSRGSWKGWTSWWLQLAGLKPQQHILAKWQLVELRVHEPLEAETFTYQPAAHLRPTNATAKFIQQLKKKMEE